MRAAASFARRCIFVACALFVACAIMALPRTARADSGYTPRTITMDGGIISRHALDGQEAYCCDSWLSSPPNGTVVSSWHSGPLMLDYVLYHAQGGADVWWGWEPTRYVVWAIMEGDLSCLTTYGSGEPMPDWFASQVQQEYYAAKAWADAGGVGPERGCSQVYDPPVAGYQPIAVYRARFGSLKVQKVRDGGPDDTFTFHATVTSEGSTVLDETFTLKGGESKTFEGMPVGGAYSVEEVSGADRYTVTWSGQTGTIGENTTVTATCTNKVRTGSLKVMKVRDGGHEGDEFTFHVRVVDGSSVELDETFTLRGGESRTFDGLIMDATYEVEETGGTQHYETEWSNRTGRIAPESTVTVTCTNISHGWLGLEKVLGI